MTARPGERTDVPAEFARHRLAGLGPEEARRLLASVADTVVDPAVAFVVADATGGNALAIQGLAQVLSPAQLAGSAPLPDPLPVGRDVRARFGKEVAGLPERSRRAVAVLALAGSAPEFADTALARLGLARSDLKHARPATHAGTCGKVQEPQ